MAAIRREPSDGMLWLLGRWGLLTAGVIAGLLVTFFTAYALVSTQPGIGGDHDELLMAAVAPAVYRLSMVFDALGWVAMGGLLVVTGMALRDDAPILSRLGTGAGITAVVGVIGAFLRLGGTGDLGSAYSAAGADQAAILSSYRLLSLVISAHFAAGQLTVGLGFLAIGRAALAAPWCPRRIAWLVVLPGLTSFTLLTAAIVLNLFLFPVLLLHVAILALAGLTIARRWWGAGSTVAPVAAPSVP